jgi:CubicO group peptidase (beta-lactamase class C family)
MHRKSLFIGLIVFASVIVVTVLAIIFIPRLVDSEESSGATWPTQRWSTSTPEEQGFDSVKLAQGLQNLKKNNTLIDSLLIIRNGHVILDAYFYPYDSSIPHNLASVTKSVTTTLIGIAIDQGKIQLDQSLVSLFPDRTIANLDDWKKSITIRNLVSNMNGYESGCLAGDNPTIEAMQTTPDWVQYAMDRRVVWEPGNQFCYDSPGMHLLSAVIQQVSGMTELEYAKQNLFEPLGIDEVYWEADPQGYTHGWGDLYLKPLDAAKLGYLWLNQGAWEGKQIVPATWVADSIKPYNKISSDSYGYGWWVSDDSYFAYGRGGQTVKVYPQFNAIVVVTGNGVDYNQISTVLEAAFLDPEKPLPANPSGVAQLESTVGALALATHPWQAGPLPDTAGLISGYTYTLDTNILELTWLRFEFKGNIEARMFMHIGGEDVVWSIGLDGKYRVQLNGEAVRGYWSDPQTFVLELFENGLNIYQMHFKEDKLILKTSVMEIEGRQQNP